MKIKFYGTRGSIPICDRDFQDFGGNTTCVQVTFHNGRIGIIDAGSGMRNLGKDLIARNHRQDETMFIAMTHFHWDHIQGFPFFAPAYDPKRHFTICSFGLDERDRSLKNIFAGQMQQSYFPVALEQMGAGFNFLQPGGETFEYAGTRIISLKHNHPGGAYTYRVESGGKVFVFCTDIEHINGLDSNIVNLARDADLLVHEAQFTPEELKFRKGCGHSSWEQAIEVGTRAKVKKLVLTHHDPDHNDEFLFGIEKECQQRFPDVQLARERMEVEI